MAAIDRSNAPSFICQVTRCRVLGVTTFGVYTLAIGVMAVLATQHITAGSFLSTLKPWQAGLIGGASTLPLIGEVVWVVKQPKAPQRLYDHLPESVEAEAVRVIDALPSDIGRDFDALNTNALTDITGSGAHRLVFRINESDVVVKYANRSNKVPDTVRKAFVMNECLVYDISEELGFHVVPETVWIPSGSPREARALEHTTIGNSPVQLQRYIKGFCRAPTPKHAHKAFLFNKIIGRSDASEENSIVDETGKVWLIDSEFAFGRSTAPHWLDKSPLAREPIDDDLLEWVLALPDTITLPREHRPNDFNTNKIDQAEDAYADNLQAVKGAIRSLDEECLPITPEAVKARLHAI